MKSGDLFVRKTRVGVPDNEYETTTDKCENLGHI